MERAGHERELTRAFTSQAAAFAASAVANADEILDAIVEQAQPQPTERWLESACGPGIVSRRLAPLAHSVVGVDITPAMIELARRRAAAAGADNTSFELADATATGWPAAGFDAAVTRFSLHHVPVPVRLISEMARLVRPGGRIVVADHIADEDGEPRAWAQEVERLRDPSHWASLPVDRLRDVGRQSGLELIGERRLGYELDFADWLVRGTSDPRAHELVERALTERPSGTGAFGVERRGSGRVLTLQIWVGAWRRN
jgi:SAM-dependent methyltransferase